MAKITQEEKEERRLKEILKAYQAKPQIYSVQTPGKENLPQTQKPKLENLPEFDLSFLKMDLAKSLALTLVSFGIIIAAFFLL